MYDYPCSVCTATVWYCSQQPPPAYDGPFTNLACTPCQKLLDEKAYGLVLDCFSDDRGSANETADEALKRLATSEFTHEGRQCVKYVYATIGKIRAPEVEREKAVYAEQKRVVDERVKAANEQQQWDIMFLDRLPKTDRDAINSFRDMASLILQKQLIDTKMRTREEEFRKAEAVVTAFPQEVRDAMCGVFGDLTKPAPPLPSLFST